ncbi:hypothetical protein WN55_03966 [Dufourea novaeangliae]|uniref:Uncharacterized protein n=1 Tax=Dufourea novaeangliae TaxID=178035 RepID=A0A154PKN3_DUFNO|nr:hypothetical protein WN55_03966 [Dufourea novaeangliae]
MTSTPVPPPPLKRKQPSRVNNAIPDQPLPQGLRGRPRLKIKIQVPFLFAGYLRDCDGSVSVFSLDSLAGEGLEREWVVVKGRDGFVGGDQRENAEVTTEKLRGSFFSTGVRYL